MIKLFTIPDTEQLLNVIDNSRGNVTLHLPDGMMCDMKRDGKTRQLLKTMSVGKDGLSFQFSDADDVPTFVNYMVGMKVSC